MANPHSDANWVMPIISQLMVTIATSSASSDLRVTFFWVADQVLRVCRPQDSPTARAPGCLPAASPVGVVVAGWPSAGVLEFEAPDASRAPDEVTPKPLQSTEVTSGGVAHLPASLLDRVLDVRAVQGEVVGPRRQRPVLARVLVVQTLAVLLLLPTLLILHWSLHRLRLLQIQQPTWFILMLYAHLLVVLRAGVVLTSFEPRLGQHLPDLLLEVGARIPAPVSPTSSPSCVSSSSNSTQIVLLADASKNALATSFTIITLSSAWSRVAASLLMSRRASSGGVDAKRPSSSHVLNLLQHTYFHISSWCCRPCSRQSCGPSRSCTLGVELLVEGSSSKPFLSLMYWISLSLASLTSFGFRAAPDTSSHLAFSPHDHRSCALPPPKCCCPRRSSVSSGSASSTSSRPSCPRR